MVCPAGAAEPPVLVVVNRESAASVEIGDYYARRRGLGASRICALRTTTAETVSRERYEGEIEGPVRECLSRVGAPVRFLVTTLGLPLRVEGTGGWQGTLAAVDSELALGVGRPRGRPAALEGPAANPLFGDEGKATESSRHGVYLTGRLAAYDAATVKRMVDSSLAARSRGQVVLDLRDTGGDAGDRWLTVASFRIAQRRVLFNADSAVVRGARNVIGYASWGSNDPARKERFLGFGWLPGGLASEFVSTNGRTLAPPPKGWQPGGKQAHEGSAQTLAADYLAEGATAATAHTDEPYLAYTPRPQLLFPAYLEGRALGEAFWMAVPALSWTNMLLGDPLTRLAPAERAGGGPRYHALYGFLIAPFDAGRPAGRGFCGGW